MPGRLLTIGCQGDEAAILALLRTGLLAALAASVLCSPPARADGDSAVPTLEPIVVTGTRTAKIQDDSPVRTEVVTHEELQRTHARTLKEALENVPGLQLTPIHGKSGYQVSLQGMDSDQVLVLIDGLPISPSTGSTTDLSQYALADVDHIEVVKGATSAQYGSSAMGGVINVITRPVQPGLGVNLEADAGSYGSQNVSGDADRPGNTHAKASLEGGNQILRARLSAETLDDDGFATDPDSWARQGDGVKRKQYAARLEWRPVRNGYFWFDGSGYRENDDSRYEYYVPPNDLPQQRLEDISRDRYSGGGDWRFDNGTHVSIKGLNEVYQSDSNEYSQAVPTDQRDARQELNHVTGQLDLPFWRGQLWTLGGDYHHASLSQSMNGNSELQGGEVWRSSQEMFIQNDIFLGERWELLLGGRWQNDSDFGNQLTPKINLRAHVLQDAGLDLTLRASYGQGYRVPNLKERYFLFDHSALGYKVIGNPDLQPERSDSWQLGANFRWRHSISADINLFYNKVDDLIQVDQANAQVINGISYYSYRNVDQAETRGVETSVRWQPSAAIGMTAAYTYTHAEDMGNDIELTGRPKHIARLGIDWTLPTGTTLTLRDRYQSDELVDTASGARSPAWNRVDLIVNQTLGKGVEAFVGIDNLFDQQRDFTDSNDFSPITGRYVYLGFRYHWQRPDSSRAPAQPL